MLRNGLKKDGGYTVRGVSAVLLIAVILSPLMTSCAISKKLDRTERTPTRIVHEGNAVLWCVDYRDMTMLWQEAERCR